MIRFGVPAASIPNCARRPTGFASFVTPEGVPLPANTLAELKRDMARLSLIKEQLKGIIIAPKERSKPGGQRRRTTVRLPRSSRSLRVIGMGIDTADMLVHEALSRDLSDRRAVARYAGLTGSPDESGGRGGAKRACRGRAMPGSVTA